MIDSNNYTSNLDEYSTGSNYFLYSMLFLLTSFMMLTYGLIRMAERSNRLNYEDRFTRIIAGFFQLLTRALHTTNDVLNIPQEGPSIIAAGPHRTGVIDSFSLTSKLTGNPPRFFATDAYNKIPGVGGFLKRFKTITVTANKPDSSDKRSDSSANSNALEAGIEALEQGGCVALFPQGNFSYLGKEAPKVYDGAAKLAIRTKTPIHVVRLDGFWSLQNRFIPTFIRNNAYYRAILSAFHMNNVKTTLCCVIDYHLQPENEHKSEDVLVSEINAQLYAYFRHTGELTPQQIGNIQKEIETGKHRDIWSNKYNQGLFDKKLRQLKEEYKTMENESAEIIGLQ